MVKNFQITVLILLATPLFSVSKTIVLEDNIEWSENLTFKTNDLVIKNVFAFKNASYLSEKDYLCQFSKRISLKNEIISSIILLDVEYKSIDQKDITGVSGLDFVKDNIDLSFLNLTQKKKQFGELSFIPIIYNSKTSTYLKVISYKIQLITHPKSNIVSNNKAFGTSSVLATGEWFKVGVLNDGVYKLSYQFLKSIGMDVDNLSPNDFKLYGNGGKMLPTLNSSNREDDLTQNAIHVEGASDGVFNTGDFVLFYGQSPHSWKFNGSTKFEHELNKFSDTTYYFLTFSGTGETAKRISTQGSLPTSNQTVTTFNGYDYYERDLVNLIKSGDKWFGDVFDLQTTKDYTFSFPNILVSSSVYIDISVVGRSGTSSSFTLSSLGGTTDIPCTRVPINSHESRYADTSFGSLVVSPSQDNVVVNLSYNKPSSVSVGWLDEIELNTRRNLIMHGNQLFYRDINSVGVGNVSEFRLKGFSNDVKKIWDITDPFNIKEQQFSFSSNIYSYKLPTDVLKEFVAFNSTYLTTIHNLGKVDNQNLHAISQADMIIVSHPDFLEQSEKIADFHTTNDGLNVIIVTPQQIYNEFSSGSQDIVAIRDFIRMLYEKAPTSTEIPQYLLLFGDGSYDNKNRLVGNSNFVPTYQSPESMLVIGSLVSDDYYGLLDPTEGTWNGTELVDIAIGRIPAKTQKEANNVVNKILNYNTSSTMNEWRNNFVFVGDDEDELNTLTHMDQSNQLATMMDTAYKDYNVNKIFNDAFTQVATPGGSRYPDVNTAINRAVENGALVINYTGHGGEVGWAHERVLTVQDVNTWSNTEGFPLFITATCEFSRFDDPARTTAGELVLLNKSGGVGLLTTVRLVFSQPNFNLNITFYEEVFKPTNGQLPTMGEVFMRIKNRSINVNQPNNRNFTLLGDPALRLAYPIHNVVTTKMNGANISSTDTIKSLSKVTIEGEVQDDNGNKLSNFNGIVYPTVFDKTKQISTLNNDGKGVFNFNLQTSKLFKGKVSVVNGSFTYTFVVPKDISYNFGQGKLSYYAENQTEDANGYLSDFYIGGTADNFEADEIGPEIELFMNDENFVFGGITDDSPILLANISDVHGINMVGNGIGHDIIAILDGNTSEPIILNDFYEADLNSYQNGKVAFPFSDLKEGRHKLTLKVWDVYNNSSEATIEFVVVKSKDITLERVYNYPNPFTTYTEFWFEHNQPGKSLYAQVQIFTVSGKLVKTIAKEILNEGYRSTSITWDGLDEYGDRIGRGVYVYRLKVRTENFSVAEEYQKLVILR